MSTHSDLTVFEAICRLPAVGGTLRNVSARHLAADLRMDRGTIARRIAVLETEGKLFRRKCKGRRGVLFEIVDPKYLAARSAGRSSSKWQRP